MVERTPQAPSLVRSQAPSLVRSQAPSLVRSQAEAWEATRDRLDATHRALTGEAFPAEVSDAAARARLCMLILGARDHAEPGECVIDAVVRKGIKMTNKYKEGTLAKELADQMAAEPAETKARDSVKPTARSRLQRVKANPEGGNSNMQQGGQRFAVFKAIEAHGEDGVAAAALEVELGIKVGGYLQKLLQAGHILSVAEGADNDDA